MIGLLIIVTIIITERFIVQISDWIAIPLLLAALGLIIAGGIKNKEKI